MIIIKSLIIFSLKSKLIIDAYDTRTQGHKDTRNKGIKGFTLMELMVVICIISNLHYFHYGWNCSSSVERFL